MFIHTDADLTRTEYRWEVDIFTGGRWERYAQGIETKEDAEKLRRKAYRDTGCKTQKYSYAINVYDPQKIRFRIWALQQDNLHRSDIIDRSKDPGHIKAVTENMKRDENEIAQLLQLLEEVNK